MKKAFRILLTGAGAKIGYLFGIIGTIATLWSFKGELTIPIWILTSLGLIYIAVLIMWITSISNYASMIKKPAKYPIHDFTKSRGKRYAYIDFTPDIRYEAIVAIYCVINNRDRRIGFGIVNNIVDDDYIEIFVLHIDAEYKEIYKKAINNNKQTLKRMYILPRVYKANIPQLSYILEEIKNEASHWGTSEKEEKQKPITSDVAK